MKILIAIVLGCAMLAPSSAAAKGRTTITSYKTITGTTHTTIRSSGQKPTKCTSYTNITGTTKTTCR